jgi:hypothetical protein
MSSRERYMLVGFVLVALVLWGSLVLRQIKQGVKDRATAQLNLTQQNKILDSKTKVESDLAKAKTEFQNTPTEAQLLNEINGFVADSNLNTTDPLAGQGSAVVSGQKGQSKEIFNTNLVDVKFNKVSFRALADFASRVNRVEPVVAITELTITGAVNQDPHFVNGEMKISSLELIAGKLDLPSSSAPATPASVATIPAASNN